MSKYFGTDGIRGIANQYLTPELAYRVGRAAAVKLTDINNKLLVIGSDTRRSGDMLACSLMAGFMSMGFDIINLGIIPTPAVAYLTRYYHAAAGAVISASHNPGEYNGIKFFDSRGLKLPDALEEEIEELLEKDVISEERPIKEKVGIIRHVTNGRRVYMDFLKSKGPTSLKGLKIAVDCGHGATYEIAGQLFLEMGADVTSINTEPDGMNINRSCGSTNPQIIQRIVKETNSDFGVSFDGDGDRVIAVDEKSNIMDGDHIIAACATFLQKNGRLKNNGVVGTVMTNIGLQEYMNKLQVEVVKTAVGDRYVLEKMLSEGYVIGGEQSGHIIFSEDNTTGDGILTALKVMEAMLYEQKPMSVLNAYMTTYPQVLVNAKVKNEMKYHYMDDEVIAQAIDEIENMFHGEGRVLIRASGTEPLVRVMIEGKDQSILEKEAKALALLIEERLN